MIINPEKVFENYDWNFAYSKLFKIIENIYIERLKERGDVEFSVAKKKIYYKTIKNVSVSIKK